jgi:deoxyribonuclease-4
MVFVGAHISRETTLIATMEKIKNSNGNALQIFASNPRSTKITKLNEKFFTDLNEIKAYLNKNNFALVIHSPYTINLATPFINGKRHLDLANCYWIQLLLNELIIAHQIGSIGCVVHTGKFTKNTPIEGLSNMKQTIQFLIAEIKRLELSSKLILETSTGQGTELLFNYQEFLDFYNSFDENEKNYFKICIDTCHIWAAGHELDEVFTLTKINGNLKDVAVIHINNSKNPKNSHLDRHEIINEGYINIKEISSFVKLMKSSNSKIILILETPDEKNLIKEISFIK